MLQFVTLLTNRTAKKNSLFYKIHWSVSFYPQLFFFSIYITKWNDMYRREIIIHITI